MKKGVILISSIKRIIIVCISTTVIALGIWYINVLAQMGQEIVEKEYKNVEIIQIKDNKVICKIDDKNKVFKTVGKANKEYKNKKGTLYLENNKVVKVKLIMNNVKNKKSTGTYNVEEMFNKNIKISGVNLKNNKIRVVLKTNNYSGIKHKKLSIKSTENLVITYNGKKNQVCGKKLNIDANSKYFKGNNKISISVADKSEGIKILSIKRAVANLDYFGTIDVIKEGKNLVIINEVDVEQYLYSVVPSEMPESFGYEALKVQAICARTYAYTHIKGKSYKKYNAHVDDSISYQVYNNQKYGKETKKAVDHTKGMVLTYKDDLAKVFYYSTSCGYSSETKDVFGGNNISYMKSKKQSVEDKGKVDGEKAFKKFILSTDKECFEKKCEWFRWEIKWNVDKLTEAVNRNLKELSNSKVNNSIYVLKGNKYRNINVKNIGTVKNILISKRGSGGIIKELVIKGTKSQIRITSQNLIRQILGPINVSVKKQNNSKIKGMDTLPSAFFIVEKKDNNFIITGGGFGHGVGMSQWGVFELTKLEMGYEDIIAYYFKGTEIRKIS